MFRGIVRQVLSDFRPDSESKLENRAVDWAAAWRPLVASGCLEFAVPRKFGGYGPDWIGLTILFEELGRACYVGPLYSTIASLLLLNEVSGEDPGVHKLDPVALLENIRGGSSSATISLTDTNPGQKITWTEDGGLRVTAEATTVDQAIAVDRLLITALLDGEYVLIAVAKNDPGVVVSKLNCIDGDSLGHVSFHNVEAPPANIGRLGRAPSALERRSQLLRYSEMIGGSGYVIDETIRYASQREVFGRPIGAFQSTQHQVVDASTLHRMGWLATRNAAQCLDSSSEDALFQVAVAGAISSRAYLASTLVASEVHAGSGHIVGHWLPPYFARAKGLDIRTGGRVNRLGHLQDALSCAKSNAGENPVGARDG